jgi:hypothetical protein
MSDEGRFIDGLMAGNMDFTGKTLVGGKRILSINALNGAAGATAGWVIAGADTGSAKCPASQTASTFVVPVNGLLVGDVITGYSVYGQIEGDGAVTLDVDLRKLTAAAADLADASVGAITQISTSVDAIINASKTGLGEIVGTNESFYFLCTATTAGGTDIDLQGFNVTVNGI